MELLDDHVHYWNACIATAMKARRHVSIGTFGIHLPPKKVAASLFYASEHGAKVKLMVGRHATVRREAVQAIVLLQAKLKTISEFLPKAEIRVMPAHTKLFMNEDVAIIGGRNLSFSTWPDLSFRFYRTDEPMTFKGLTTAFNDQFEEAQPLKAFLKIPQTQWERDFEKHQEERIESKTWPKPEPMPVMENRRTKHVFTMDEFAIGDMCEQDFLGD